MWISKPIPRGKMRIERVYQEYGVREENESILMTFRLCCCHVCSVNGRQHVTILIQLRLSNGPFNRGCITHSCHHFFPTVKQMVIAQSYVQH